MSVNFSAEMNNLQTLMRSSFLARLRCSQCTPLLMNFKDCLKMNRRRKNVVSQFSHFESRGCQICFPWYNIPTRSKIYQLTTKYIKWPSIIYPNRDFSYENIPFGNPIDNLKLIQHMGLPFY
jgi:hypothetical protein